MNKIEISIIVVLGLAVFAGATPIIDVGEHNLMPDQAGQEIEIYVTGGDTVQGLEFNVRIGEGVSGPTFDGYASDEGVDILTGTIFADPNNQGIYPGSYIYPYDAYVGTTTPIGTAVNADGLLATLTFDTTGIYDGQYSLSLIFTFEGRTNFAGVYAAITDGTIVVSDPMSGDRNGDGFVGQDDLDIILGEWDLPVDPGSQPDPSGDGFVGQDDLDIVINDWGKGQLPAPEPATAILLVAGAFGLLGRKPATKKTKIMR